MTHSFLIVWVKNVVTFHVPREPQNLFYLRIEVVLFTHAKSYLLIKSLNSNIAVTEITAR